MANSGNDRSANDPSTATKRFIKQSKVAGLTPTEAVQQLIPEESASNWNDAQQIAFDFFNEQMNGGDADV